MLPPQLPLSCPFFYKSFAIDYFYIYVDYNYVNMWYYLPDWFKWIKGKPAPSPREEALSEIIKKRAEEQNAIIERQRAEDAKKVEESKVAEKDFFE